MTANLFACTADRSLISSCLIRNVYYNFRQVYIYDGEVHLVQNSPSNTTNLISVPAAIERIRNQSRLYKVPATISNCIRTRISNVTQEERYHKATVYLPASAALILKKSPSLIAAAVRAFCHRDPIDMKACRAMKHFPPEIRIYTEVTFTRCLYAMLSHTKYNPDRRTGWSLPEQSHETFKAHDFGMKIACGLEILASRASPENATENDKNWHLFLNRLKEKGYFGDNIEHSKGYTQQIQNAKEYYKIFADSRPSYVENAAQDILSRLNDIDIDLDSLNVEELQAYSPNDDSEDWLNISTEDLDKMLAERYGITKSFASHTDDSQAESASALTKNINAFLDQKSEFDGVDVRPVPPKRGIKKNLQNKSSTESAKVRFSEPQQESNDNNNIDFNPDSFQQHLKDMLDMIIPEDNWDSQSDMSDFDDDLMDKNIEDMGKVPNGDCIDETLKSYMDQMDRELAGTTIGKSFQTIPENKDDDDDFDDIESFEPVNIDVNALQNLAESYQAQFGGHGPAASLLGSLGMRINAAPACVDDKNENKNGSS